MTEQFQSMVEDATDEKFSKKAANTLLSKKSYKNYWSVTDDYASEYVGHENITVK